jgi:hypothetical protein
MHSRENVLIILHSSKRTYEMIQLPGKLPCGGSAEIRYPLPKHSVLASYDRGIHYVTISDELQLQVWILLTESTNGQLSWILAHDASLQLHVDMVWFLEPTNVTWRVIGSRNGPVNLIEGDGYGNVEEDRAGAYDSDYSWNSDEENFADVLQGSGHLMRSVWRSDCRIIGFHPHKNALILLRDWAVVVYHLDTLRMQFLGHRSDFIDNRAEVNGSFVYRGCYADVLPAGGKKFKL